MDKDMRPNETAIALDSPSEAALRFIGLIRTPWTDREHCSHHGRHEGPECRIVLEQVWHEALKGLEAYDIIEVLYWLAQGRRDLTRQNPRSDGDTVGIFAQRLQVRPNPIATALVRLHDDRVSELEASLRNFILLARQDLGSQSLVEELN